MKNIFFTSHQNQRRFLCIFLFSFLILIIIISFFRKKSRFVHRKGTEANVYIDRQEKTVRKIYLRGLKKSQKRGFENNIFILKRLNDNQAKHVPKLISFDPSTLTVVMSYVGEPLTKKNAPKNIVNQLYEIKNELLNNNITWIDPAIGNFTIENGIVYIIDFGIRTRFDSMKSDDCSYQITHSDKIHAKRCRYCSRLKRGPLDISFVIKSLKMK